MTHSAALSRPASRSADRSLAPLAAVRAGPAQARLSAVAGTLNQGSAVQRLAALGAHVSRVQASVPALPAGEVVQRLMTAAAFATGRAGVKSKELDAIQSLLATYAKTWGYPTGFGEYYGAYYRQERLRLLNDIEHQVHGYFRDSGTARIADAPASALMLGLLDDAQAEHEKQIRILASHSGELPVDDRALSKDDKSKVLDNWQRIVSGSGNLRITETQNDKGSGLTRTHAGFRTKALSGVARLLQDPHGRDLIGAANKGGGDAGQHITIAPVGRADHVVKGGFFGGKGGTITAGGWAAEALDQKKNALISGKDLADEEVRDLDGSGDPLAAFEDAAAGHDKGVMLGARKYAFNKGTGSRVDAISDHRDSENRVVTRGDLGAWREGLSPTSVTLGHEIGHAVRNRRGANVDGNQDLLALVGTHADDIQQWSGNDEELVNIRQVENKLLAEKHLAPRDFHKDYHGAVEEALEVRGLKYRQTPDHSKDIADTWRTAMSARKFDEADKTLRDVGY